jgi:hypothetical protein
MNLLVPKTGNVVKPTPILPPEYRLFDVAIPVVTN